METVVPFRAWRYAPTAGELSRLVAPPYDVIGPDLQSHLYANSRYNVVRVDLGIATPTDSEHDNQYTRAAAQLADWKTAGILVRDLEPSITFVEESFIGPDGRASVRHGFLAAMRLRGFDEGVVFPHEHTLSGPKEDRYRLMMATAMSLSPVFLLYDLPSDEITTAWKTSIETKPPDATTIDHAGTTTKLWPTADPDLLRLVGMNLAASRFVIADGHHRYETALRYQKYRRDETSNEDSDLGSPAPHDDASTRPAPATQPASSTQLAPRAYDYALAYFCNMADPGLTIYGTHRLLAGLDPEAVANLPRSLTGTFAVERLTSGGYPPAAAVAQSAITTYLAEHPRSAFGLWGPGFDAAYGLQLKDTAAVRKAEPYHSAAYQELDVTILQALVLERALGISPADMAAEKHVTFFKDPSEAFARLESGEFQAGLFMNPTRLDQIRQVAFGGERMPQKATFFYPKLPTGLVFHDLSGSL